jgi:hypothetical protein
VRLTVSENGRQLVKETCLLFDLICCANNSHLLIANGLGAVIEGSARFYNGQIGNMTSLDICIFIGGDVQIFEFVELGID